MLYEWYAVKVDKSLRVHTLLLYYFFQAHCLFPL